MNDTEEANNPVDSDGAYLRVSPVAGYLPGPAAETDS